MLRDALPTIINTPKTSAVIAVEYGQTVTAVNRCLNRLRDKGLVHIAAWRKERHICAPMWKWGKGEDAPRPEATSAKILARRKYDALMKRDPDYYKRRHAKRKAPPPPAPKYTPPPLDSIFASWSNLSR